MCVNSFLKGAEETAEEEDWKKIEKNFKEHLWALQNTFLFFQMLWHAMNMHNTTIAMGASIFSAPSIRKEARRLCRAERATISSSSLSLVYRRRSKTPKGKNFETVASSCAFSKGLVSSCYPCEIDFCVVVKRSRCSSLPSQRQPNRLADYHEQQDMRGGKTRK